MLELLDRMCRIDGVSGNEDAVRMFIEEHVREYSSDIFTDVLGNLYVFKKGKHHRGKTIVAMAHMDEVGFIVKEITPEGYIKFAMVGGIDSRIMLGIHVRIGKDRIKGVIGVKAAHLTTADERKKLPPVHDMYIDIGAKSKEDAMKYVELGDYIAFDTQPHMTGSLYTAKAIDDRLGCAVMMQLLSEELEYDTWFVFSVQEEIGGSGATVAANRLSPDIALLFEATTAADLPGVTGEKRVCSVGGGAVMPFADRGTIYTPELIKIASDAADRLGLKHQTKSMVAGATDAAKVSISGRGVETIAISLATRYLHSPVCTGAIDDMHSILGISRAFLAEV